MAFANEYISPEDREKYGLNELDAQYQRRFLPMSHGPGFTIDRERESYIRFVKLGRICEERGDEGVTYYSFYWHGVARVIRFQSESEGRRAKALIWKTKYFLRKIDPPLDDLTAQERLEFFTVLKEALIAYRDHGVFSEAPQFEATFDF